MGTLQNQKGFIRIILLIVIILVVLGFFGIDVRDVLEKPAVKDNVSYAWGILVHVWENFLRDPAIALWQFIGGAPTPADS